MQELIEKIKIMTLQHSRRISHARNFKDAPLRPFMRDYSAFFRTEPEKKDGPNTLRPSLLSPMQRDTSIVTNFLLTEEDKQDELKSTRRFQELQALNQTNRQTFETRWRNNS